MITGTGITGSGVAMSDKRAVSPFSAIEITGSFEVTAVCQAAEPSLEVTGDDNIVPMVHTEVDGDLLRIFSDAPFSSRLGMKIHLATADVDAVSLTGSGSLALSEVTNEQIELSVSGSGRMTAQGRTKRAALAVSGSGHIATDHLDADEVRCSVTGSGQIRTHAASQLMAVVTGSGHISYGGHPSVTKNVSGSGSITPH